MKVLVLGCNGQVGFELMQAAWPAGSRVVGAARPAFDLADPARIDAALSLHRPDLVVNAAAYTAVDKAESDRAAAFAINATGPELLAAACAREGVPLVHISTDYVFDGTASRPYREDDPVRPLNVYGASKAAGEAAVRLRTPRHVILRTSWVYGVHGSNFVKTMLRLGREREEVAVVADQHGAPTSAADIAAAIVAIARQVAAAASGADDRRWGTYHFSAAGETTWHGIAERIFAALERHDGRRPRLKAITTAGYPTPARRPANSRLDCTRIETVLGIMRAPWGAGVDRTAAALLAAAGPPGETKGTS